jgi:hypothetical protein
MRVAAAERINAVGIRLELLEFHEVGVVLVDLVDDFAGLELREQPLDMSLCNEDGLFRHQFSCRLVGISDCYMTV